VPGGITATELDCVFDVTRTGRDDVVWTTTVALTVAGKVEVAATIMLESFMAELAFVELIDDEIEEVASIAEKDEVKER